MRSSRPLALAFVAFLAFGGTACSSDSDSDAADATTTTTTTEEASDDATAADDADTADDASDDADAADDSDETTSGGHIEASSSTGATLSATPSECTIDGTTGRVATEDGMFDLTFADGVGTFHWAFDGGELDEEPAVAVTGNSVVVSGMTEDGSGYNAEITCG